MTVKPKYTEKRRRELRDSLKGLEAKLRELERQMLDVVEREDAARTNLSDLRSIRKDVREELRRTRERVSYYRTELGMPELTLSFE